MPSKIFGPTDSVADTLTQVGTSYQLPPSPAGWIIYKALVGKGNVVNGKSCSGHIHIETVNRSYDFAYGNGGGGATNNGQSIPAEPIDMALPAPANTTVKVYVLDADVAKDVVVALQFAESNQAVIGNIRPNAQTFKTLSAGGVSANADTAADTEESFTVSAKLLRATLAPETDGKIYQIRYAGTGVIDAKANSGYIKVYVAGVGVPYEYAIGNGPQGATLGGPAHADVINIPEGIPVKTNSTVDIKITTAEIVKSPVISCSYW